jgi:NACHT domain- and WD repeat-containing protein
MLPPSPANRTRTIRIFISSTFRDFQGERTTLHRLVFPKIAEICRAEGFEFEPIDLRWGVSDDAARDRRTTEICLDEIDRSRQISPRLNFLFLVGNRYGWRPLPESLHKDLFDQLIGLIERDEPDAAAKIWTMYRCDDNSVPPSMRLYLPTGGALSAAEEAAMVEAFTRAAKSCGAFGSYPWPGVALTEMEINRAFFSGEADVRPLGLIRSLSRMPDGPSDYVDSTADGQLDEQAFRRVEALRSRLLALSGRDIVRYDLALDEAGRPGDMTGFAELALQLLTQAVMREIQERSAEETKSSVPAGRDRIDTCIGRRAEAEELIAQVEVATAPILVTGPSGVGKSVFLSLVAEEAWRRHPLWTVVEHYVGVTAASAKPDVVLRELCDGISAARGSSRPSSGLNSAELRSRFGTLLRETKPERPLLVLIDGLDQVLLAESGHGFDWLRGDVPPHVRLLLSATPDVVPARLPTATVWELPGMAPGDAAELLDAYLADTRRSTGGRRRLTDAQRACVLEAYSREKLPLFLRLLAQDAAGWPSWMAPPAALPATVRSAIGEFFERLSEPNRHGAALVKWSAAYLCAARAGLSRREIMELLSRNAAIRADLKERSANSPHFDDLPDVVWSRLRFDLDPFLNETVADGLSLMAFFHSGFATITQELFAGVEYNRDLAAYFDTTPDFFVRQAPNQRKCTELPYQLDRAKRLERLATVLTEPHFLMAKCLSGNVQDLVQDYQYLPESKPTRRVGRSIEMSMQMLADDPGQLATQMAGRMWDDTEPCIASFVERVGQLARRPGLRPQASFLRPPDSALLTTIMVHGEEVRGIAVSPDGKLVASAEYGQAGGGVTIWEFETRQVIGSFRCGITAPDVVRFCNGSRVLLASRDLTTSEYEVWDWKLSRRLRVLPKNLELPVELSTDGRFVLSRSADGHAIAVWNAGEDGPSTAMASQDIPILAFHEANGALVTGSADGTVRLWDLDSRQEVQRFHVSVDEPCKGQILSILADGRIILCQTSGGLVLAVHDVRRNVLVGRPTAKIPAWNGIKTSINGKNHSPSIDPRLTILSVGERIVLAGYWGMDVRLWDAAIGQQTAEFPINAMVGGVAAHRSRPIVLSGSQDKAVRLWAAEGQDGEGQDKRPRYSLRDIAIVADRLLATTGSDGIVRLWDVASMAASEVASTGASTFSICMIPGTQTCVTGNDHDVVAGWDLKDGTQLFSAKTDTGGRQCMRISPDGAFLASTTARGVKVWAMDQLRAGSAEPVWTAENDAIFETLRISADGTRLICSWDNTHIHVKDLRTGACLLDIDAFPPVEVSGTDADGAVTRQARTPDMLDWIHAVAVTPDGRYLLANSWDHSIAVWDLESGAAVHTMYGHTGTVSGIEVTPDGRYAVSVSDDQTARLWSVAEGRLLDTITCESQLLCCQVLGNSRVAIGDTAGMLRVFDIEDEATDRD